MKVNKMINPGYDGNCNYNRAYGNYEPSEYQTECDFFFFFSF